MVQFMNKGAWYFFIASKYNTDMCLLINSTEGNLTIYTKLYQIEYASHLYSLQFPNSTYYDYKNSIQEYNYKQVIFLYYDFLKICGKYSCGLMLSIECISKNCEIYFTATPGVSIAILENEELIASVNFQEYTHFEYNHVSDKEDIAISLKIIEGRDSDIYIAKKDVYSASIENHQ